MLKLGRSGPKRVVDPDLPRDMLGFVGEGTVIEGVVELQSGFRTDGRIAGQVRSLSTLVVGPTGEIASDDLRVKVLSVSGRVHGQLRVEDRLEIRKGGRVKGTLELGRAGFVIEPGGAFEGTIRLATGDPEDASRARPGDGE